MPTRKEPHPTLRPGVGYGVPLTVINGRTDKVIAAIPVQPSDGHDLVGGLGARRHRPGPAHHLRRQFGRELAGDYQARRLTMLAGIWPATPSACRPDSGPRPQTALRRESARRNRLGTGPLLHE
jgi:hypothetical protein